MERVWIRTVSLCFGTGMLVAVVLSGGLSASFEEAGFGWISCDVGKGGDVMKGLYSVLLSQVLERVDRGRMQEAVDRKKRAEGVDMIQDVIRRAVLDSTACCYNSLLHVWTGRIYEPLKSWRAIDNLIYDCMRECGVPEGYYGRVRSMAYIVESAVRAKELTPDPALMVFSNCVYDTETMDVFGFSPDLPAVTAVDYPYDRDNIPQRWLLFLNRVLPDKKMQDILQEFLGAVFIRRGNVTIDKMLILLGGGANGKSVIYETVKGVLGKENVKSFGLGSLIAGGERLKNIATLNGRRLNYSSEIQVREFGVDEDKLKSLASGEQQEARFIGENSFSATDIPLLMANANRLPSWNDPSSGFRRRFLIIPFEVEIPPSERDPRLAAKLREDYSGIFNWMMEGRTRLVSNNFRFSCNEEMEKMLDEIQSESSTVLRFMLERKYRSMPPDSSVDCIKVVATDLYQDYVKWCYTENIATADIDNRTKFGRTLTSANYRKKEENGKIVYMIYGDRNKIKVNFVKEPGVVSREKRSDITADIRPFNLNGRKYVRTRYGLAKCLNVGEGVLETLRKQGKFKDMVIKDRDNRNMSCYDIELCRRVVMDFMQEKKRSEEATKERQKISVMRTVFNQRMEELGEPYRKYGSKRQPYWIENKEGIILVPDDWDYYTEIPESEQSGLIQRRKPKHIKNLTTEDFDYEKEEQD